MTNEEILETLLLREDDEHDDTKNNGIHLDHFQFQTLKGISV